MEQELRQALPRKPGLGYVACGVVVALSCLVASSLIINSDGEVPPSPQARVVADIEALTNTTTHLQAALPKLRGRLAGMREEILVLEQRLDEVAQNQMALSSERGRTVDGAVAVLRGQQSVPLPTAYSGGELPVMTPGASADNATDTLNRYLDTIANAFLQQHDDQHWARGAELKIAQGLETQKSPVVQLTEVTCRTTLCRIVLSFDESAPPPETLHELVDLWGQSGPMLTTINDAEHSVQVFLAREGHVLPVGAPN